MNKPQHYFLFLATLGVLVFSLSALSPKEKWQVGPFELGFYTPNDLLGNFWTARPDALDTAFIAQDSNAVDALADSIVRYAAAHAYTPDTAIAVKNVLSFAPFFDQLDQVAAGKKRAVRVLHYGDSQLEGDRITSVLRNALQQRYGGGGFGYVAMAPLVAPSSLEFKDAVGWERKTVFGRRDTAIKDNRYGHLASFTSLVANDTGAYAAHVTLKERRWGYASARNYSKIKLFLEGNEPVRVAFQVGDSTVQEREILPGTELVTMPAPDTTEFDLLMEGDSTTRIFGISFESGSGVQVDNVAMRGASGLMFTKMDSAQLARQLQREGYQLVVLQFGGNTVPYLRDEAHAIRVGRSMARQLDFLKEVLPNAQFLYIGPSDMARKEGLAMESYPLIIPLKQSLKSEVLKRGHAYWDLQDVMGGPGSMVRWVEEEPTLAVRDYIHFTPDGAKWVGQRLVEELLVLKEKIDREREAVRLRKEALLKARADSLAALERAQEGVTNEQRVQEVETE